MSYSRFSRSAFTLIELLVAVTVIAILAALLLPVLGRAREMGRRALCTSNQRQIGMASALHADDKDGRFPVALRTTVNRMGWICVWNNHSDFSNDDGATYTGCDPENHPASDPGYYETAWKVCGTPWSAWQAYGLTDEVVMCPSARRVAWTEVDGTSGSYSVGSGKPKYHNGAWMGDCIGTGYIVYSGNNHLLPNSWCKGRYTYTDIAPAYKATDLEPDKRIIASDAVWTDPYPSDINDRYINHPKTSAQMVPDYQARVFADGHVDAAPDYPDTPLPLKCNSGYAPNYCAKHGVGKHDMVFYWEPPTP